VGYYAVSVIVESGQANPAGQAPRAYTTNEVTFALLPTITVTILPVDADNTVLQVEVDPPARAGQRVSLLLSDLEFSADSLDVEKSLFWFWVTGDTLTLPRGVARIFNTKGIPAGQYWVRLRVDGVDSMLFDPNLKVMKFDEAYHKILPAIKRGFALKK
jgi:hypothetical protein